MKSNTSPDYGPLVNALKESNLLDQSDCTSLQTMHVELQEAVGKAQRFRTRTEMEVASLNDIKFPTPASKYWQAMREQTVMLVELVRLSSDYRESLIKIKLKQLEIDSAPVSTPAAPVDYNALQKELLVVDMDRLLFDKGQQEREAKARARELRHWSEIKEREALQMSREELASVDNHQLISYTKRWIKQSIAMGGGGSPAERQNLLGQLRSGVRCCTKNGVMNKVLEGLEKRHQDQIKAEYGIK